MNINDYIKKKGGGVKHKTQSFVDDSSNTKTAEEAVKKYSGMSEPDLMQELFKQAEISRKKGELTNEGLDDFYDKVKCFLSPEQCERMKELLIELKK